ncbi:hypothetical protein AC481_06255 [miscellaneous Crenarchaeota group archaeon SMTZ-80]|nr:MAG: hypothetical protein AC481_06255 [miscellaneous Crenarchaeota group archaeon SMTZ-80]
MRENKIIIDIEQLSPEWLTSIFKNKGYFSQGKVTKVIKKNSQETLNSNIHFLEINYSSNAQTKPTSPSIFVKILNPISITIFLGKHEAKFCNIISDTTNEIPIPICYDAAFSEETGLSYIILENLYDTYIDLLPVLNFGRLIMSNNVCPYCKEEIKTDAIIYKHCHSKLHISFAERVFSAI